MEKPSVLTRGEQMTEELDEDDIKELEGIFEDKAKEKPQDLGDSLMSSDDDDDDDDEGSLAGFMEDMGSSADEKATLEKPWMAFHEFHLVTKIDEVKKLIDDAIKVGEVALDLETEGFDNRIEYDSSGKPYTVHNIVGYCLGLEGRGYYIPLRHHYPSFGKRGNVSPPAVHAEIARLCHAAQPVVTEEGLRVDPFGSKSWTTPPQVIVQFWNAKFDQEFLYPVTGLDWWHPDSFEDGMLANYTLYTDDDHGLKENSERKIKPQVDPKTKEEYRYTMIKFEDLFPSGMKKKRMKFADLMPSTEGEGKNALLYGGSDGICTNLVTPVLVKRVNKHQHFKTIYRLEKQVTQAVRLMERYRVKIDKKEIITLLEEANQELELYDTKIRKLAEDTDASFQGFNPGSTEQLGRFLFSEKGLQLKPAPALTADGQFKTDEKTLAFYVERPNAPEVLSWVIKYRQIDKVRGTYLENLANNTDNLDQLRLNFRQTGAATGRFTAPKGNADHGFGGVPIHGIPAYIDPKKPKVTHSLRRTFIARDGYIFVKADYASQELRIAANVSGEKKWIREYMKELQTGEPADLHFMTAQAFYPGLEKVSDKDDPAFKDYKLKRGAGKCVHPDTLVATQGGLRKIGELGKFGVPGEFTPAPEGLRVDGNPVTHLYNGGVQKLVHVVATHTVVTCTENHRFKLADGSLVRAGDLVKGQALESMFDPVTEILTDFVKMEYSHEELTELGSLLAAQWWLGDPYQIKSKDQDLTTIGCLPPGPVADNCVLEVVPAGEGPCVDITMGTLEHLYCANGATTHNTANFALVYGGGVGAVQRATGCDPVEGARLKKQFDESVPQFSKWVKRQHTAVKKQRGVFTAFGRFLAIPDAKITPDEINARLRAKGKPEIDKKQAFQDAKRIQAACERKSTNFPIQGCKNSQAFVLTRKGQKRIGALHQQDKPFEVWVGDQWAPAVARDMGPCELAEIRLEDGTLDQCDTRHKLLIVSEEGYDWVEYPDLEPGMAVATSLCEPLEFEAPAPLPEIVHREKASLQFQLPPNQETDLWYWLGRYLGDGWLEPRGGIVYSFGDHEQEAIQRCCAFWTELGLNPKVQTSTHTPAKKESTRHRVEVWSVDLYDWLLELGLQPNVTAHTKRVPPRVFQETLEHRASYIKGVMASDGHKPKLPLKIDGVWEPNKKGNPYNVHLCQRPVLVDLKRVLRTLGVESTVRGPYRSGADKMGEDTTSYRLDIQRRMFERHIMANPKVRLPKFKDMYAPKFLVQELLDQGPFPKQAFQGNESAYNLYLRLRGGGQVTVYTLQFLCQLLEVSLQSPLYGYKRLLSKTNLGREEHTYTLSVDHELHRFESDGVITKNSGADIMKISLVMLFKELRLRGWLKEGGDDSVRPVMTVHDEVVFEIRKERVAEALPILLKIMEFPDKMPTKRWGVPLIAEAELGNSWNAPLDWLSMLRGDKNHPRPDYLGDAVIDEDPKIIVLEPYLKNVAQREEKRQEKLAKKQSEEATTKEAAPATKDPGPETDTLVEQPSAEPVVEPKAASSPEIQATTAAPAPKIQEPEEEEEEIELEDVKPDLTPVKPAEKRPGKYFIVQLSQYVINLRIVCGMFEAVAYSVSEAVRTGRQEELLPVEFRDCHGNVVYSSAQQFMAHPEELGRQMRELNLSSGEVELRGV